MFKTSKQPRIGENGYQYYTYDVGATWKVETETGTVLYQIIEPCWDEDGEYQSFMVAVESQNVRKIREMTLDRLNYLFDRSARVEAIDAGEPAELPLTKAEVEQYYQRIVKERYKRKKEANAKLKESKEYQALQEEEKQLTPKWIRAIAERSDEEAELGKRMEEITRERRDLIRDLGIEFSDLATVELCFDCNGKGITKKGGICACARERENEIKAYCAAERVVERRRKT